MKKPYEVLYTVSGRVTISADSYEDAGDRFCELDTDELIDGLYLDDVSFDVEEGSED